MSERITQELLHQVVREKGDGDDICVTHYTLSEGCEKSTNFGSDLVSVTAEVQKGKEKLIEHLIVKVPPTDDVFKMKNSRSPFINESVGYCSLIPAMVRLQVNIGVKPFGPSVPQHRFGGSINNAEPIFLDNLRHGGYKMSNVYPLDYEHCRLVMKELANYHTLAYALKIYDPDTSKQIMSNLKESRWVFPLPGLFKKSFNICLDLAEKFTRDESVIGTIQALRNKGPDTLMKHQVQPTEPYAVICHGDFWCNNMMFSYQSVDGKEEPVDVKMFDLQRLRYSLPTIDLSSFFYTSTNKEMRRNNFDDLLATYHSTFIEGLQVMKLDLPEFSLECLAKLYKQTALYGILFVFLHLPAAITRGLRLNMSSGIPEGGFQGQTLDLSTLLRIIGDDPLFIREKFIEPLEDIVELDLAIENYN